MATQLLFLIALESEFAKAAVDLILGRIADQVSGHREVALSGELIARKST